MHTWATGWPTFSAVKYIAPKYTLLAHKSYFLSKASPNWLFVNCFCVHYQMFTHFHNMLYTFFQTLFLLIWMLYI